MELSRTALGLAAGIAGTLFLGYCVYFDQQRRKDPLYKKKLRERKYFYLYHRKFCVYPPYYKSIAVLAYSLVISCCIITT